ncbi:glyoxalase superfamily protein [Auraticoccus monumenti]|nr:glyoxalase superfamily protein [Auraticoccus monumenti]
MGAAVPVLRIFEEMLARDFYLGWLGFTEVFAHRFAPGLPLYLRVRRDDLLLDLSGHHGDGTPGTAVWVPVADLRALQGELLAEPFRGLRPGIEADSPGGPTMEVLDPFGSTLRFCQTAG